MPNRAQRRAAARAAATHLAGAASTPATQIPEPGEPFPSLAQLNANLAASKLSDSPATPSGVAATSVHKLTRHNGTFQLLATEDPIGFEALKQSLQDEHQPTTETEAILVNTMAEAHWLADRAQILIDSCFDPETGKIVDEKRFSLYLRYQTTHTRAFHKSLNDLLKLRAERRKAGIGFEAQKRREAAQRIQIERHEMKKQTHYWDVLRKDGQACHQIAVNTLHNLNAAQQHPGFEAQFTADLAAQDLKKGEFNLATPAAA